MFNMYLPVGLLSMNYVINNGDCNFSVVVYLHTICMRISVYVYIYIYIISVPNGHVITPYELIFVT